MARATTAPTRAMRELYADIWWVIFASEAYAQSNEPAAEAVAAVLDVLIGATSIPDDDPWACEEDEPAHLRWLRVKASSSSKSNT